MALGQDFENSSPSTEQHERFIHGDACQPSREARLFLEGVEMKEGLVEALLYYIFGIFPVIRYPSRHGENSLLVTKNQSLESLLISALCGSDQRAVGVFVYATSTRRFHKANPPPLLRHEVKRNELARQPQRISNGLEYRPLLVRAQNAIPVENG